MQKVTQAQMAKKHYESGGNILEYLKKANSTTENDVSQILIGYDLQAGTYIQGLSKDSEYTNNYCGALAKTIDKLGKFNSMLEVGVGEATTLGSLIRKLDNVPQDILGFDISWSRLKFAKEFLFDFGIKNTNLFTANLFNVPLLDNTIDVVYTSHSIEPNGGKEEKAIKELYRIARKYLILLEPSYELADEKSRKRMKELGYVTKLLSTVKKLGYKIIEYGLFSYSNNPLNPTGIMIIEKKSQATNELDLRCPNSLTELVKYKNSLLFSTESLLAYPVIEDIPCLLKENSVLATHLLTDYNEFKEKHQITF